MLTDVPLARRCVFLRFGLLLGNYWADLDQTWTYDLMLGFIDEYEKKLKMLTDVPLARRCVILLTHVEINSLKLVVHLGSYIAPRLDSMSYLEMACRFVTGSLMCHPAYRCARLTTIIA